VELRNTAATLGPMIDTRAAGGYVVGPGSTTPDGVYRLTDDRAPADLPAWLVQALTPKLRTAISAPVVVRSERLPPTSTPRLRGERDRVAAAQPGTHNKTLFVAAVALGRHVGEDHLPSTTAQAHLYTAAAHMISDRCDCTEAKVLRTIRDGLRAGASTPRPTSRIDTPHRPRQPTRAPARPRRCGMTAALRVIQGEGLPLGCQRRPSRRSRPANRTDDHALHPRPAARPSSDRRRYVPFM
jgi:hypothetical protein